VAGAAALVDESGDSRWTTSAARGSLQARSQGAGGNSTTPCSDRAYSLIGGRWNHTFHWAFNSSSTPAFLSARQVEAVIKRSFSNITRARNDCGIPDNVSARHVYDGRTTTKPNVGRYATCTRTDGWNLVGFGRLPRGVLAVTCTQIRRGKIVEADMLINSRYRWAVSTADCSHQELIEPTVTHEAGHVFGLGHVSERRHPLLTMSTTSDGPCSNEASTLGRGDIRGLEALY
jgi:hypothetical protein